MTIGHIEAPPTEVAAGTGPALLMGLANAGAGVIEPSERLGEALEAVGDPVGEAWFNLIGIPLDAGPPFTAARLVEAIQGIDPVELRRHLFGRYAWSWARLGGEETIEAAAEGDRAAIGRLFETPRYYGGRAPVSLGTLAFLGPDETKERIAAAVRIGAEELVGESTGLAVELSGSAALSLLAEGDTIEAIERLTGGYRYVPEPEAERIILIPHPGEQPWLVLAQHRAARVIVYAVPGAETELDRVVALGQALADPMRVRILALLGRGSDRVAELVEATELARSTVHHHLAILREAGLVRFEGNARAYRYRPAPEAAETYAVMLADLLGRPEEDG